MNLRFVVSCGLVFAALVLTGCDDGRKSPGRVGIQVANAAPGFESLTFRREQDARNQAALSFKGAQAFVYDADTYDFYIAEPTLNLNDPGRNWTLTAKLEPGTDYTVVLSEVAGEVQPVLIPSSPAPSADAQILAMNATSGLPAIDLYLERAGVGIAGATPRGTLGSQQQLPARTLPSGDYELFLTTAGNPADVLLTSQAFNLVAGTNATFVVVPENGQGTAPLSVLFMGASPTVLVDMNAPSELRAINAATDQAPRDLAIDSQFSPPLFSAMPFGEPTPYAPVPIGSVKVNVTPVGNPGVLEVDTTMIGVISQRATMLFNGPAGTLAPLFVADDGRRLNRYAKVRFMNAASQFIAIDFVLTLPDGDPISVPAQATLFAPGIANYTSFYPGDYDLYVFRAGETTVLSGPTRISLVPGGLYSVLAVDGPDASSANALLLDDFP